MSVAVALATLGRAGAVLRGGQNATQVPRAESPNPCDCRIWKNVYSVKGGSMNVASPCGMSQEYFFASGVHQPSPEHVVLLKLQYEAFCKLFFEKIDDNVCVNVNIGAEYGQWCYVDSECKDLQGATGFGLVTGNKQLRWKKCTSGRDRMLKDFSVTDMVKFVKKHDIPFQVADHYAWPTFYHGLWSEVRDYFRPGVGSGKPIGKELREELDAVVAYGKPVTFDVWATMVPPHTIVEGTTRYRVVSKDEDLNIYSGSTWNSVYKIDDNGVNTKIF